jgi:hypothetical protein
MIGKGITGVPTTMAKPVLSIAEEGRRLRTLIYLEL